MMIRRLAFLACLSAFLALPAPAIADTGSGSAGVVLVDAGVAPSSSDAAVVTVAPPANATQTPAVPEPVENPGGFIGAVKDAWAHGWALALLVAIVGLLEGAIYAFGHIEALKKFGEGRKTVLVGGALATLTAVLAAYETSAKWSAAFIAGAGALLAYWHQAGTDPSKG